MSYFIYFEDGPTTLGWTAGHNGEALSILPVSFAASDFNSDTGRGFDGRFFLEPVMHDGILKNRIVSQSLGTTYFLTYVASAFVSQFQFTTNPALAQSVFSFELQPTGHYSIVRPRLTTDPAGALTNPYVTVTSRPGSTQLRLAATANGNLLPEGRFVVTCTRGSGPIRPMYPTRIGSCAVGKVMTQRSHLSVLYPIPFILMSPVTMPVIEGFLGFTFIAGKVPGVTPGATVHTYHIRINIAQANEPPAIRYLMVDEEYLELSTVMMPETEFVIRPSHISGNLGRFVIRPLLFPDICLTTTRDLFVSRLEPEDGEYSEFKLDIVNEGRFTPVAAAPGEEGPQRTPVDGLLDTDDDDDEYEGEGGAGRCGCLSAIGRFIGC